MKQKIIEELLEILNDMRSAEAAENHVAFIQLKDGRTAEITIKVNTDEDDFISEVGSNKVFILKNKTITEFDLP